MSRLVTSNLVSSVAAVVMCSLAIKAGAGSSFTNKPVHVERFGTGTTLPLMILLHGVGGPTAFSREQAVFFAKHGFRVVLPHYLEAGHGTTASDENYEAWTAAVREVMDGSPGGPVSPTVVVGYSLGASVALALGSQGRGPDAIAEFYGSLPDRYFRDLKGMPPLLILHGDQDNEIPVNNALQLSRLCSDPELRCEIHIYPKEGHGFAPENLRDADQRTLRFFSQVLQTVR